jgi:hypothetical protein
MHVAAALIFARTSPPYERLLAHVESRLGLVPRLQRALDFGLVGDFVVLHDLEDLADDFLAALLELTSAVAGLHISGSGRLLFRTVVTRRARLSTLEAGIGPPVLAIHGRAAPRDRSCSPPRHWPAAFASSPLTFRASATPTSRSAQRTTPASSPTR